MMSRSDLDGYRARVADTAHLAHAVLARLRRDAPQTRGLLDELGDSVAELAELCRCALGELERTRIREHQARQGAEESRAEAGRARQALTLSRSRYAELADVTLATLAAIAHGEDNPGAHLEHTLEAHGHSPRLAEAMQCRQVLADPATWRRALEVA